MERTPTSQEWEALDIQTHGLPPELLVPIAAVGIESIETYVGVIQKIVPGRKRPINAIVVEAHQPDRTPAVPLWDEDEAERYYRCFHPSRQLWVHVDFNDYRRTWKRLGLEELTRDIFLDHIRNREAVRMSGYRHPFLRLCPVSRETNTNSGLDSGVEGIEKVELRKLEQQPEHIRERTERRLAAPVVLADPFDLTKMLDIPPGLSEMQGVADMLLKFYPQNG